MAASDNLSSVQGDSGSDFARSRQQSVRVKPYLGADKDSTRGRGQQWDEVQPGGATLMDLGDKPRASLPTPMGSNS